MIKAPWTQEQVDALNRFQRAGIVHPFTCGSGRRTDKDHLDGEGVLVATPDGWVCPYCDYRQDWAHEQMLNKDLMDRYEEWHRESMERLAKSLENEKLGVPRIPAREVFDKLREKRKGEQDGTV